MFYPFPKRKVLPSVFKWPLPPWLRQPGLLLHLSPPHCYFLQTLEQWEKKKELQEANCHRKSEVVGNVIIMLHDCSLQAAWPCSCRCLWCIICELSHQKSLCSCSYCWLWLKVLPCICCYHPVSVRSPWKFFGCCYRAIRFVWKCALEEKRKGKLWSTDV